MESLFGVFGRRHRVFVIVVVVKADLFKKECKSPSALASMIGSFMVDDYTVSRKSALAP